MHKVIEVSNLSFGYENRIILDNISFSVAKGDFLGIVGPNGSGKSTLLKLLLRILAPSSGEIMILGEKIDNFTKWQKTGYISQKANSFNSSFPATVEEVVGANLFSEVGIFRPIKKHHKEQVYDALEKVGMQEYKSCLIGNLSGGQQQRVFIARVLVSRPEIMFLDEPTVGIDVKSEDAVYCLLAKLNREMGITVIMVTHDISAVTVHANKIACVGGAGLIVHEASDKEVTNGYLAEMYNYGVNLHVHEHNCGN